MENSNFEIGKTYSYNHLSATLENEETGFEMKEYGEYLIGENLLVYQNNNDCKISFILIGDTGLGGHYKCVYNN